MARYFMGDTRLAGLERMMMDPSRTPSIRNDTRKKRPQKKLPCSRPVKPQQRKWEIREEREEGGGV
ncbi:hypothetical protein AALA80_04890 [Oscillospiraceae bacterium 50-60]